MAVKSVPILAKRGGFYSQYFNLVYNARDGIPVNQTISKKMWLATSNVLSNKKMKPWILLDHSCWSLSPVSLA